MRIGIDNVSPGEATSRTGPGGMRDYVAQLIAEFRRQAPQHEIVVFSPRWTDPVVDPQPGVELVMLPGVPKSKPLRVIYQQTMLPAAIRRAGIDVFFAIATVAPLSVRVPVVLSIQFLQFYETPEAYGRLRAAYLRLLVPASIRKAARTIVFTESTARDLVRFTGLRPPGLRIVPHGLSPALFAAAAQRGVPAIGKPPLDLTAGRPFIIDVSATYSYKNHVRLIQAFGRARQAAHLPHVLVLVGSEVTVRFTELQRHAREAGVADAVVMAGRVEDVAPFYRCADLAVMPSLYETFGFPVLEAMVFGCPVLTSNIGSMAELAGDAALLVDPYNVEAMSEGIVRALTDGELRAKLAARGPARAAAFTWDIAAARTLRVLEEAAAAYLAPASA